MMDNESTNGFSLSSSVLRPVNSLGNFEKRFRVPTEADIKSQQFVQRIAHRDLEELMDDSFDLLRNVYDFKRKELQSFGPIDGVGSIKSPKFSLEFSAYQSSSDPSKVITQKEFMEFVELNDVFSNEFTQLGGQANWSFHRRLDFTIHVSELIDAIEDTSNSTLRISYRRQPQFVTITSQQHSGTLTVRPNQYSFQLQNNKIEPREVVLAFLEFESELGEIDWATQKLFRLPQPEQP